jgi:hypothetical protein
MVADVLLLERASQFYSFREEVGSTRSCACYIVGWLGRLVYPPPALQHDRSAGDVDELSPIKFMRPVASVLRRAAVTMLRYDLASSRTLAGSVRASPSGRNRLNSSALTMWARMLELDRLLCLVSVGEAELGMRRAIRAKGGAAPDRRSQQPVRTTERDHRGRTHWS